MQYLLLLIGSALIQGGGWYFLPLWGALLAMHGIPLGIGLVVIRFRPSQDPLATVYYYYVLTVSFLGPFATLGSLLAWGVIRTIRHLDLVRKEQPEDSINLSELDKVQFNLTENLWAENESVQVAAFVDIMKGDDRSLKQNTIDKVVQHPSRLSVGILREGLKDQDPDIRYYAASGLIQLNDLFQKRIGELRYQTHQSSDDADLWYQLGTTYENYCYWGLASHDNLDEDLDKAEACLEQCLLCDPKYETAYSKLGGLLIRRKKAVEAISILKLGLEHFPQSVDLMGAFGEALYEAKQYKLLEEFAQQCILEANLPEHLEKSFYHWAYTSAVLFHQESDTPPS